MTWFDTSLIIVWLLDTSLTKLLWFDSSLTKLLMLIHHWQSCCGLTHHWQSCWCWYITDKAASVRYITDKVVDVWYITNISIDIVVPPPTHSLNPSVHSTHQSHLPPSSMHSVIQTAVILPPNNHWVEQPPSWVVKAPPWRPSKTSSSLSPPLSPPHTNTALEKANLQKSGRTWSSGTWAAAGDRHLAVLLTGCGVSGTTCALSTHAAT